MRIFLTGADGQLGRELQKRLPGTDCFPAGQDELDVTDSTAATRLIREFRPDVVVHCAAWTEVDRAESLPDAAFRVNAEGTRNIAVACSQSGAAMVYISTDYVFDGTLGRAYAETDNPNPLNVYGRSKLAGETLARQEIERLLIVRSAWLFGDGNNFVRTLLKMGRKRETLPVVDDQYGSPTSAADLAEGILRLIRTGCYGTYHLVNEGVASWFGIARKIFELTGNKTARLEPVSTEQFHRPARRPAYAPLDARRLRQATGWTPRSWEEALREYLETELAGEEKMR